MVRIDSGEFKQYDAYEFYAESEDDMNKLAEKATPGSYVMVLTSDGLKVYMFNTSNEWILI